MRADTLEIGDLVQIDPAHDDLFGGCVMLVTEPRSWGAQGLVRMPGRQDAYYRCPWAGMERVGRAVWQPKPDDAEEDDGDSE